MRAAALIVGASAASSVALVLDFPLFLACLLARISARANASCERGRLEDNG